MSPRFSREQVAAWLDEADRIVDEAEQLVIAEGGSRASRAALRLAIILRSEAFARAKEAA